MLITKTIKVKFNYRYESFIHKYELGEDGFYEIDVKDLPSGSSVKVIAKCDFCGKDKKISFKEYNLNTKRETVDFSCSRKCCIGKKKDTCIIRFGVESNLKTKENLEKSRKTCLEKYGVDSYTKTEECSSKIKKTKKDKYGDENYNNIEQIKLTNLKKYGVDNPMKTEEIKKKRSSNRNPTIKKVKVKVKKIQVNQNEIYRKVNMKIASDENYIKYLGKNISEFKCEKGHVFLIDSNLYNHRRRNNNIICTICNPKANRNKNNTKEPFFLYRKEVRKYTNRYKKELFQNWDGYDFYDKEYIRENFNLKPDNNLYPSIDHKVSIYYGFKHDIDPKIIGNIENLCITKRINNMKKSNKNFEIFKTYSNI